MNWSALVAVFLFLDGPLVRIDSQIRANRLILANRFRVPVLRTEPFLANCTSGG